MVLAESCWRYSLRAKLFFRKLHCCCFSRAIKINMVNTSAYSFICTEIGAKVALGGRIYHLAIK